MRDQREMRSACPTRFSFIFILRVTIIIIIIIIISRSRRMRPHRIRAQCTQWIQFATNLNETDSANAKWQNEEWANQFTCGFRRQFCSCHSIEFLIPFALNNAAVWFGKWTFLHVRTTRNSIIILIYIAESRWNGPDQLNQRRKTICLWDWMYDHIIIIIIIAKTIINIVFTTKTSLQILLLAYSPPHTHRILFLNDRQLLHLRVSFFLS